MLTKAAKTAGLRTKLEPEISPETEWYSEPMNRHRRCAWRVAGGLLVALALASSGGRVAPALAQHAEGSLPHDFDEPIRLYTVGLGTFTRPISSSNAEAQKYFNQGFQLMYGFAKAEAGRSFREAQKRDPQCAICYWGEAWAWGPYVSDRMTADHGARAYAAIQKALRLADSHANAKEQAFIQAMGARYSERFDPVRQVEQDRWATSIGAIGCLRDLMHSSQLP